MRVIIIFTHFLHTGHPNAYNVPFFKIKTVVKETFWYSLLSFGIAENDQVERRSDGNYYFCKMFNDIFSFGSFVPFLLGFVHFCVFLSVVILFWNLIRTVLLYISIQTTGIVERHIFPGFTSYQNMK